MPRLKPTPIAAEVSTNVAVKVRNLVQRISSTTPTAQDIAEVYGQVDKLIKQGYKKILRKEKEMSEDDDFHRKIIASRYGVSPPEVTDAFLDRKLEQANREGQRLIEEAALAFGITLKPDTPEYRDEVNRNVQKIIAQSNALK